MSKILVVLGASASSRPVLSATAMRCDAMRSDAVQCNVQSQPCRPRGKILVDIPSTSILYFSRTEHDIVLLPEPPSSLHTFRWEYWQSDPVQASRRQLEHTYSPNSFQ